MVSDHMSCLLFLFLFKLTYGIRTDYADHLALRIVNILYVVIFCSVRRSSTYGVLNE